MCVGGGGGGGGGVLMTAFGNCLPNTFQYRPKVCVCGGGGEGGS